VSKHLRSLCFSEIRPGIQEQVPEILYIAQQVVHYMDYNQHNGMRVRLVLSVMQITYEIHFNDEVTLT
jgi:hypothetical protein